VRASDGNVDSTKPRSKHLNGQQKYQFRSCVSWLKRVRARRGQLYRRTQVSMESLILAQDERWRRA
jgi:hypothetical protein